MDDPRTGAIDSVEMAIAHLADALAHLDRLPASDRTTISFVAHAMNNYLSVADGALELLERAVAGHPNPEVVGWIVGLRHLGTLMEHAVGRLFQTSDSADAVPLKLEHVDLPRLIERVCDYYRRTAEGKGLKLTYRQTIDVPLAWGDRVAVAVVADNLLSNAMKFSNPGGEIVVEVFPGPGGVGCRVCHAGPGLSAVQQSTLFKAGVRPGSPAVGEETFIGYGLTIVRELVDRMNGRVWIESEPGHGACFAFRIPYPPMENGTREGTGKDSIEPT